MKKIAYFLAISSLCLASLANADVLGDYIPQKLSDANMSIAFEVDSTWHLVKGKTSDIAGQISFSEDEQKAVQASFALPVAKFDTGLGMRDSKMREVMKADKIPNVEFVIHRVDDLCSNGSLLKGSVCSVRIVGQLQIAGVTKSVNIPAKLELKNELLTITGTTSIKWKEYEIEDPSIFVAKLDETAVIKFAVRLAAKPKESK